jgi:hypothetical protein
LLGGTWIFNPGIVPNLLAIGPELEEVWAFPIASTGESPVWRADNLTLPIVKLARYVTTG